MVFSSIPFVYFFLPLCLAAYFLAPFKFKNGVLLIFSLVFYAWGEPVYILLMLLVSFSDYCIGRLMEGFGRKKIFLLLSVFIDLGVLGFFKYADFVMDSLNAAVRLISPQAEGLLSILHGPHIALPIGISFFTFQSMSYIFDLYKGDVECEKSYIDYITYISMFPQLIAGPIVRYATVHEELHNRKISRDDISAGAKRFAMGLFKKVLIANQVGQLFDQVSAAAVNASAAAAVGVSSSAASAAAVAASTAANMGMAATGTGIGTGVSAAAAWLGAAAFTLQLYFDFSAYSDMAIGIGRILGFHFNENFDHPLSAVSVTDFWRRWHISLSTWFRDYVYIPLGGNRHGAANQIRNMLIVWFLTGLWHGASWNFVFWGLWHFSFLILEKHVLGRLLDKLPYKLPYVLRHIYALAIVIIGFTIFAITDITELSVFFRCMFANTQIAGSDFFFYMRNYGAVFALAFVLAFPVYDKLSEFVKVKLHSDVSGIGFRLASSAAYALLFIITTAYLVADTYNPFLYFRF